MPGVTRFRALFGAVRATYWFIPALMAVAAVALSFALTTLDASLGSDWIEGIGWLYANKPAGARAVLSTIAGSMITVAGVTFSLTIAAVSYATGQIGPRLISNFMRDRANQITLGTFIGTFLYCLMVLRTVHGAGEDVSATAEMAGAFVPHVAILVALVFALAGVAVLIFFIHHVPESINVSNLIAAVGRDLLARTDELFAVNLGRPGSEANGGTRHAPLPDPSGEPAALRSTCDGYIQTLDAEALMRAAVKHDFVARLALRPGDFTTGGSTLLDVWPAGGLTDDVAHEVRACFAFGTERTPEQDILFLVNELVEIIARALSPGVNDPFTAITAMDWLKGALSRMAREELPDPNRYDDEGRLRVIAAPVDFPRFASAVFDQSRQYVSTDRNAALHMLKTVSDVVAALPPGEARAILLSHAKALNDAAQEALKTEVDRRDVQKRYRSLVELSNRPAFGARVKAG